jgi:hypothetical protein
MSPKIRCAAALVILVALTCGSLGALPLGSHAVLPESDRGGVLAAVVDWFIALFTPDQASRQAHKPAHTKAGSQADPNGGG